MYRLGSLQNKPPERASGGASTTVVTSGSFGGKPKVMRKKNKSKTAAVPAWARLPDDSSEI